MDGHLVDEDATDRQITRALGDELRRVRDGQGLTRADVAHRMATPISIQTLSNYEHGIRQCPIPRLVEICEALQVPVTDLLALALQRARIGLYSRDIQVDLNAVAEDADARPELRAWAHHRLAREPDVPVARLERAVVDEMANVVGSGRTEFARYLLTFTPSATRPWAG
jgi:transcriptional regulator with XRE-family HTH domain